MASSAASCVMALLGILVYSCMYVHVCMYVCMYVSTYMYMCMCKLYLCIRSDFVIGHRL
jgi:hypothetical protein